jgi:hypothetical protein
MTHQIPYADYVRIEIHAEGKAQIVELRPDNWQKVKAQVTLDDPESHELFSGFGLIARKRTTGVELTLKVSGPQGTMTFKDLEASQ